MRRKQRLARCINSLLFLLIIFLLSASYIHAFSLRADFYNRFDGGEEVSVEGVIYHKETKGDTIVSYVRTSFVGGYRLLIKSDEFLPLYSNVKIAGKVSLFDTARNEGEFDERAYYEGLGILFAIKNPKVIYCKPFALNWNDFLFSLQQKMSNIYEACLYEEEAGVISAVTFGDKNNLSTEVRGILAGAGIAHILAVSGLHISVVGKGCYRLLRKIGASYGLAGGISFLLVMFYGIVCGMTVSCIRAVGMFLIFVFAEILGRPYHMGRAALLMAILILFFNPFYVFSSSFIFSFGAVAGVCILAQPATKLLGRSLKKYYFTKSFGSTRSVPFILWEGLIKSFVSSLCITLFTLPIVAWFYYEIPVYSVLINLIVLPVMGALLMFGLAGGLLILFISNCCGGFVPVWSSVGRVILFPCHVIIYYLEFVSDKSSLLPGAKLICGRPTVWSIVLYYIVLIFCVRFCLIYGMRKRLEETGPVVVAAKGATIKMANDREATTKIADAKGKSEKASVLRLAVIGKGSPVKSTVMGNGSCVRPAVIREGMVFFIVLLCLVFSRNLSSKYRICFLDVGQGDGVYLTDGRGCNMMIDGGSTSNKQLGKYTILPFLKFNGVRNIDYWFVSHCDEDHVSGLKYMLENGYGIDYVCFSKYVLRDEAWQNLVNVLNENGVGIRYLDVGEGLCTKSFNLTCVFPDVDSACNVLGEDANARSLVLYFEDKKCDVKGLFTGDMSEAAEKIMLEKWENVSRGDVSMGNVSMGDVSMGDVFRGDVSGEGALGEGALGEGGFDFLKVAHHGSKYSSSREFLNVVLPRVAIISYGKNNYGHPHKDTLDRLSDVNSRILGTRQTGQITIYVKKTMDRGGEGKLDIETYMGL